MNWESEIGRRRDVEIAREHGICVKRVRALRVRLGIPRFGPRWDEQPLGQFPDSVIATALGVNPSSVRRARAQRGIATCPPDLFTPTKQSQARDWDNEPLGQMTDAKLGAKLGVSRQRIHAIRKKRGIPSFTASVAGGGS